jgi:hypothetical protein
MTIIMRFVLLSLLFIFNITPAFAWFWSDDEPQQVQIIDPYIELHSGPGSGYPILQVVDRGEIVTVIRRQTDWFKIQTDKGLLGWTPREQMQLTLAPDGSTVDILDPTQADFERRRWELGATGGQLGDASVLSLYGGYALSKNLSAEATFSNTLGNLSSSRSFKGSLLAQPFPEWRFSPFFALGTGVIETRPRSTLVEPKDTSNQFSTIGFGLRTYITRRFIFRAEVNEHTIYSASNERDSNERFTEWKLGIGVFF